MLQNFDREYKVLSHKWYQVIFKNAKEKSLT